MGGIDIPADPAPNGYIPNPYDSNLADALAYLKRESDSTDGWTPIGEFFCLLSKSLSCNYMPFMSFSVRALIPTLALVRLHVPVTSASYPGWSRHGEEDYRGRSFHRPSRTRQRHHQGHLDPRTPSSHYPSGCSYPLGRQIRRRPCPRKVFTTILQVLYPSKVRPMCLERMGGRRPGLTRAVISLSAEAPSWSLPETLLEPRI